MAAPAVSELPGLSFEVRAPATGVSPLRTDIAGFVGPTSRGPVGRPVRVVGWRHYQEVFGGLTRDADTAYAVRGYFENGGDTAYVVRLLGEDAPTQVAVWRTGQADPVTLGWDARSPGGAGFRAQEYEVEAATPGVWAAGMRVEFRYRLRGEDGRPSVDIDIRPKGELPEVLLGLPPDDLVAAVAERSRLIRLREETPAPVGPAMAGPRRIAWTVTLSGSGAPPAGHDPRPTFGHYVSSAEMLARTDEVALLAAPDLFAMAGSDTARMRVLAIMTALSDAAHDRLVLGSAPPGISDVEDLLAWLTDQRRGIEDHQARSLAAYHPRIRVADPLGGVLSPLRTISPVGHVAGVISRTDRNRGAHQTPANVSLLDAVDASEPYSPEEEGALAGAGLNPIRCIDGDGLVIWGGRTAVNPALGKPGLFIAHRRLIHRLVRAIRRVAEPLIFDTNGPALWFKFVRAINSVLLEAFRAGALKGARPEEGFVIRCDETTNPPEEQDLDRVHCEISLAPAAPMEFIRLRIAISQDGELEVVEP